MLPLLADHEQTARRDLPAEVVDYYDAGSDDQVTRREAAGAWQRYRLRGRVLRDVTTVDLGADLLGTRFGSPIGLAPSAFQGLAHPDAERGSASAATSRPFVLSTRSSTAIEDVAAVAGPWWFQVYVMRDRGLTTSLVERAAAAGARALVLTGDAPVLGLKRAVDGLRIALPDSHFGVNLTRHLPPGADLRTAAQQDPSADLDVIGWLARLTGLPVLVKGVLRGDDAVACLEAGAAGVVVSTHGGRQLDRSVASATALPEVVGAVGGRGIVLVDGGITSGADVLTALALGADAVLLGRPVLWALASGGAGGVRDLVTALDDDLAHVCRLAGVRSLAEVDRTFVVGPARSSPAEGRLPQDEPGRDGGAAGPR